MLTLDSNIQKLTVEELAEELGITQGVLDSAVEVGKTRTLDRLNSRWTITPVRLDTQAGIEGALVRVEPYSRTSLEVVNTPIMPNRKRAVIEFPVSGSGVLISSNAGGVTSSEYLMDQPPTGVKLEQGTIFAHEATGQGLDVVRFALPLKREPGSPISLLPVTGGFVSKRADAILARMGSMSPVERRVKVRPR